MAYPHKWSPISYKSSAGQRKHTDQRPMLYRWTTPPTNLYRVKRLTKEFPNKKCSKRGVEDCQKRLRTTCPLNEHPVVDVRARRALLRKLTLWGTWYRARRINPRYIAPLDRSHESSEYLKQITGDGFFCSPSL